MTTYTFIALVVLKETGEHGKKQGVDLMNCCNNPEDNDYLEMF